MLRGWRFVCHRHILWEGEGLLAVLAEGEAEDGRRDAESIEGDGSSHGNIPVVVPPTPRCQVDTFSVAAAEESIPVGTYTVS